VDVSVNDLTISVAFIKIQEPKDKPGSDESISINSER
jgi:hypothetical protein